MQDTLINDLLEHKREAETANNKLNGKISFDIFYSDVGLRVCIGNSDCLIIDRLYRMMDYDYNSFTDFRKDILETYGLLKSGGD